MATVVNEKLVKLSQLSLFKDLMEEKVIEPADAQVLSDAKDYTDTEIGKIEAAKATYGMEKLESADDGYFATYQLTSTVGEVKSYVGTKINIPKDFLIKSADLKVAESDIKEGETVIVPAGHTYIDFTVNVKDGATEESHLYLDVNTLIDVYTADEVGIKLVDGQFQLQTQDGTLTVAGISATDYNAFNDAVNAISVTGADTSAEVSGVNATTATTTYTLAGTTVDGAAVAVANTVVASNTTYGLAVEATEEAAAKSGLMKGEQVTQLNTATSNITTLNGNSTVEGSVDYKIAQEAAKTTYASDDDIRGLFEEAGE